MTDENSQSPNGMPEDEKPAENSSGENSAPKVGFFRVMGSVVAAMFGVRGSKYRERDFRHGKAIHFIIGGIVATIIFILVVYFLVQVALESSKPAKKIKTTGAAAVPVVLYNRKHVRSRTCLIPKCLIKG